MTFPQLFLTYHIIHMPMLCHSIQNLDVVIGQGSDSWLSKIDCKTLEFSTVDMEDCVEIPRRE